MKWNIQFFGDSYDGVTFGDLMTERYFEETGIVKSDANGNSWRPTPRTDLTPTSPNVKNMGSADNSVVLELVEISSVSGGIDTNGFYTDPSDGLNKSVYTILSNSTYVVNATTNAVGFTFENNSGKDWLIMPMFVAQIRTIGTSFTHTFRYYKDPTVSGGTAVGTMTELDINGSVDQADYICKRDVTISGTPYQTISDQSFGGGLTLTPPVVIPMKAGEVFGMTYQQTGSSAYDPYIQFIVKEVE